MALAELSHLKIWALCQTLALSWHSSYLRMRLTRDICVHPVSFQLIWMRERQEVEDLRENRVSQDLQTSCNLWAAGATDASSCSWGVEEGALAMHLLSFQRFLSLRAAWELVADNLAAVLCTNEEAAGLHFLQPALKEEVQRGWAFRAVCLWDTIIAQSLRVHASAVQ